MATFCASAKDNRVSSATFIIVGRGASTIAKMVWRSSNFTVGFIEKLIAVQTSNQHVRLRIGLGFYPSSRNWNKYAGSSPVGGAYDLKQV
jgi:hypothetical protein